ncbi:MAG: hypothetical protein HZA90_13835 [Verrucomicrobia bacterium]|nr:hypothetical protein [Verrucomicrobiota bacterium]
MKTVPQLLRRRREGSVLFNALIFVGILGIAIVGLMQVSSIRVRAAHGRWDWNEAYFHAENALNWGIQRIADQGSPIGNYATSDGTLTVPYMSSLIGTPDSSFSAAWLTIVADPGGAAGMFMVTASAKVGKKVRTLQANIKKNPPSQVFDYEYFLNNWGWWWGSSITGHGDNRANWDFDFRDGPTVNGGVVASGQIESNLTPIDPLSGSVPLHGLAAADPVSYLHDGSERLAMPNLKNFTNYSALAAAKGSKLYVGTTLLVNGTHTNATKPGLYLVGTATSPIKINGPVVIPGDVVIKGVITGTGTLYVGGNLYVAGDLTYKNSPSFSTPPETMTPASRDNWVQSSMTDGKDLVCFAVRESVFAGKVNSSEWKSACFDPSSYGLKNVGAEANLGQDGIADTPDDGKKFLDTNGDGTPDSAWYDADGDGVVDVKYNYATDITMTATRAGKINRYPTQSGTPENFDNLSSNDFNRLDGVFYTNHAVAMRSTRSGMRINGSIISRDEAIIFSGSATFCYDSRVHSRYSDDPNRFIDLGLPIAFLVSMNHFKEIAPVEGFCSTAY